MNKQYNFVDLFAGCGGLSLGLQQAGFTPWFVNEIVEQFCNTYKYNHELSEEHYFVGDIAELNLHLDEYKEILSDITLVCGGPTNSQGWRDKDEDKDKWKLQQQTKYKPSKRRR